MNASDYSDIGPNLSDEQLQGIGTVHVQFGLLEMQIEHILRNLSGMRTELGQPGTAITYKMPAFKKIKTIRQLSQFIIAGSDRRLHKEIKEAMNLANDIAEERNLLAHARWGKIFGPLPPKFEQDQDRALTVKVSAKHGITLEARDYSPKELKKLIQFVKRGIAETKSTKLNVEKFFASKRESSQEKHQ